MPGAARVERFPGGEAGAGDEAQFRGAVVLEDGGVGGPAARRLKRAGVQLGAGADDGADARGVDAAGQSAFAEQPQHGGDQDQPGDAVVGDGGVHVPDVEGFEGMELRARVEAFGEGVEVQARGQRTRRQGLVLLAQAEELDGGLEGLLPGLPRPGEGLGHGRGAGGQPDQERRPRIPVRQPDAPAPPGTATAAAPSRPAISSRIGCGPGRIQHGALPLPGHGRGEVDREVRGIVLREHGHRLCVRGSCLRGVAEGGPAEALPGHDDGGVVGALIGPALESVEKRHRTNFTGRKRPFAVGEDYCDSMSFNDEVQLDPSQVQDRRGDGPRHQDRRRHRRRHHPAAGRPVRHQSATARGPGRHGTGTARCQSQTTTAPACKTGADADARLDCRITGDRQQPQRVLARLPGPVQRSSTPGPRP